MPDTPYQNIDISQNNPLGFKEEIPPVPSPVAFEKLSPKVIFLIGLGIVILLVFIISLIVTSRRNKIALPVEEKATPPTETITPTVSKSLLPEIYQGKFKTIENNLNDNLNIEVPAIDLEIGL